MTESKLDPNLLRSVPLLATLSETHLSSLAGSATLHQAAARTVLFAEGGRPKILYTLTKGVAELYCEHDERSATVAVVHPMRTLLPISILAEINPLSARILEPSELIAVPIKLVVDLLGRDPAFNVAVMEELMRESREILEDLKNHRLRSSTERVAHWILCREEKSGDAGKIIIPFDKRVLASYLGMAPEHLSRSFSALGSAGVVVNGRSITVTDREALSEVAGISLTGAYGRI
jgi:CRP/FNR family transcriptional activator FtrB